MARRGADEARATNRIGKLATQRHEHAILGQTAILAAMRWGWNRGATAKRDVERMHPTLNRQQRYVRTECFGDQRGRRQIVETNSITTKYA